MKYPYIGQWKEPELTVLFVANCEGFEIDNIQNYQRDWSEGEYKNITREYLQNTYGEVQSPEHAEFIVELAKANDIEVCSSFRDGLFFNFYKKQVGGKIVLFFFHEDKAREEGEKQITIPLPPKADRQEVSEWPQVESIVTWGSGHAGVVKSLSDEFAWVKRSDNSQYVTLYVSSLEKPRTPEEELRELLYLLWKENNSDFEMFLDVAVKHITKKPQ